MIVRESSFAGLLLVVLGCNFESGGAGSGSADGSGSTGGTETSTGPTSGPTTTAPTTTGNTSASTSGPSSTTDDVTGDPSGPVDGSTGSETSNATSVGTSESSSTTSREPEEHHVEHGTQSACDLPLWCPYNGDIATPAGGPIEGVECFLAPVDPPYELVAMHYSVASAHTELEMFELRVYAWEGDEPTDLLTSIELNSSFASPMEHDHTFEPTIEIDTTGFCVGFATTEPGLASALGMAVDADSTLSDVSFVRMEGPCDAPTWQDVIDDNLEPSGNWCMDATIRTIP